MSDITLLKKNNNFKMQLSWNSRAFLKTKKVNCHSVGEKKEASASIFCMSDTVWWAIWTVSRSLKACTRGTTDGCSGASRNQSAHHHPAPGPGVEVGFVSRSLGNRATLHFHTFACFFFFPDKPLECNVSVKAGNGQCFQWVFTALCQQSSTECKP